MFGPEAAQESVFAQLQTIIEGVCCGNRASIFCYGVSGSGKTYTMAGGEHDNPGIAPRAIDLLFDYPGVLEALAEQESEDTTSANKSSPSITLSCLEVRSPEPRQGSFNGGGASAGPSGSPKHDDVYDLLADERLEVRRSFEQNRSVVLTPDPAHGVQSRAECQHLFQVAAARRKTFPTATNPAGSSRSHGIFQIALQRCGGVLTLVDLAGSEKYADAGAPPPAPPSSLLAGGAVGTSSNNACDKLVSQNLRRREALHINSSLSTLARCVRSLTREVLTPPVRDSTLTMLLQDCFVKQRSYITLIINLSPAEAARRETKGALQFARECAYESRA